MKLVYSTLAATLLSLGSAIALAAPDAVVDMYKNANCGCCDKWAEHMERNVFKVRTHVVPDASAYRQRAGMPATHGSCHTAMVGGYAVEGHVPAADVKRLLQQRPKAVGIAVPGMPMGSPGMEQGGMKQAYDVLLVKTGGATEVFASH